MIDCRWKVELAANAMAEGKATLEAQLQELMSANAILLKTKADWEVKRLLSKIAAVWLTFDVPRQKRALGWQRKSQEHDAAMAEMQARVEKLEARNAELEARNAELEASALKPGVQSERWKVEAIVDKIDSNGDGFLDTQEVKAIVAQMTGFPAAALADDHADVVALANKPRDELVEQLCTIVHPATINKYYTAICEDKGAGVGA